MKKLLIGLTLLASMSSFAAVSMINSLPTAKEIVLEVTSDEVLDYKDIKTIVYKGIRFEDRITSTNFYISMGSGNLDSTDIFCRNLGNRSSNSNLSDHSSRITGKSGRIDAYIGINSLPTFSLSMSLNGEPVLTTLACYY